MATACVGAIVIEAGRLLLVRRATPPEAGRWTIPGGRVEAGESDQAAVEREVREETGLVVTAGRLVGTVRRPAPDGGTFLIRDYACELRGGVLRAGDDAAEARWTPLEHVADERLVTLLAPTLREWGVLPPAR